jgi:hypothetical protein
MIVKFPKLGRKIDSTLVRGFRRDKNAPRWAQSIHRLQMKQIAIVLDLLNARHDEPIMRSAFSDFMQAHHSAQWTVPDAVTYSAETSLQNTRTAIVEQGPRAEVEAGRGELGRRSTRQDPCRSCI